MSFSNAACQTCKKRHLKCDESVPECQRCVKSRRTCYRAGSIIHIENSFASREKKRPRGPRSRPADEPRFNHSVILRSPSIDINAVARTYYLHQHLRSVGYTPGILKGQSDDVLRLWPNAKESGLLDLSLSCMALAVFSQTHRHPQAAMKASEKYQGLLRAARTNMSSITPENLDAYLLAVFFMARYEDSMYRLDTSHAHRSFVTGLKSIPHHEGALAMLGSWKDLRDPDQAASEVVKHTRRGVLRSALMRTQPLPDWLINGSSFGEESPDLDYDSIMVRTIRVRHAFFEPLNVQKLTSFGEEHAGWNLEELARETLNIDLELQKWAEGFPAEWGFELHCLEDRYSKNFYSSKVYSYHSPGIAAIWNRYYAMRMLLNSTRLRILRAWRPETDVLTDEQCLQCLSNIHVAGDDLAASLPFILQRFRLVKNADDPAGPTTVRTNLDKYPEPYLASMVIWPLTIASSLPHTDVKQKLWFRSEIAGVGRLIGARVFEAAETNQWLEL